MDFDNDFLEDDEIEIGLTPKGLIVYLLGGLNEDNINLSGKLDDGIKDYLTRTKTGIVVIGGKLTFVELEEKGAKESSNDNDSFQWKNMPLIGKFFK